MGTNCLSDITLSQLHLPHPSTIRMQDCSEQSYCPVDYRDNDENVVYLPPFSSNHTDNFMEGENEVKMNDSDWLIL